MTTVTSPKFVTSFSVSGITMMIDLLSQAQGMGVPGNSPLAMPEPGAQSCLTAVCLIEETAQRPIMFASLPPT